MQENGVAEHMNKTLNEYARYMRLHVGLPKMFWGDAIDTTVFLINWGWSVSLDGGIPKEVWSGKEVDLSFLKVLYCISYIHIDLIARTKLGAKSISVRSLDMMLVILDIDFGCI